MNDWPLRVFTRRRLLALAPALAAGSLDAEIHKPGPARNLPSTLTGVNGLITPADQFFVRDHFEEPELPVADWRLRIGGHVERILEISFSDLLLAPSVRRQVTLECAGNGSPGFAVSSGLWTGVALSSLLSAASPRPDATTVLLEGADEGLLFEGARRGPYVRLVSLSDCLAPGPMVAYGLNRQLLPRRQGFPARVLLPGWYGMNSVKWLRRIMVLQPGERPSSFFEMGMDQMYVRVLKGETTARRLGRLQLRAQIASPADGSRLRPGRQLLWGFAWGSESLVKAVWVSLDNGTSWRKARLETAPDPFVWTRWSFEWDARPGDYTLLSRAEDESGLLQPLIRDPLRIDGYELNQCAPLHCSVR